MRDQTIFVREHLRVSWIFFWHCFARSLRWFGFYPFSRSIWSNNGLCSFADLYYPLLHEGRQDLVDDTGDITLQHHLCSTSCQWNATFVNQRLAAELTAREKISLPHECGMGTFWNFGWPIAGSSNTTNTLVNVFTSRFKYYFSNSTRHAIKVAPSTREGMGRQHLGLIHEHHCYSFLSFPSGFC